MGMTTAEFVREQGRVEGVTQGLRCGLIVAIEAKFGPLPSSALSAIGQASEEELLIWMPRVVQVDTLAAVGVIRLNASNEVSSQAEARAEDWVAFVRHVLITNLEYNFGPVPADILASIERADVDTLHAWGCRLLTAKRLSDVEITP